MADSRQLESKLRALARRQGARPGPHGAPGRGPACAPHAGAFDPAALARTLAALGARIELCNEPGYPKGLHDLADAPPALFVRGRLPERDTAIAIVGARAATPYGRDQAERLAADLARLGFTIVSGLARGIDGAAHLGALEAGGATVAVLPGGLDAVTPRHHGALAERIVVRGALVSESASGAPPHRWTFVRRNRLIAALAVATVVVEAAERSGSLSTAAAARRMDRAVLAVPGDIDRATSRGCHALLRAGAHLCETANDVLEAVRGAALGVAPGAVRSAAPGDATDESQILSALSPRPCTVDAIARDAGLSTGETLAGLLKLEWTGTVFSRPGQRWARRAATSR